jgi:hypothetical protein
VTHALFVTGMLRSGTTLTQVLLTNHPQAWVAYQPFHQLYVDVKQRYLDEAGIALSPPLEDGAPGRPDPARFDAWLRTHAFDADAAARLAARATTGKGGSMAAIAGCLQAAPGRFADLRASLHASMAQCLGIQSRPVMGAKEILCEEYVPALADAGVDCVLVLRDPRAVIASANHGRYRDQVGDRYPLLMLIRLWRKSAEHWLRLRAHPRVHAIRYEDLVESTDATLAAVSGWLGIAPFPAGLAASPLHDHLGQPWHGNSSFGDRSTVAADSMQQWRQVLAADEVSLIEACTCAERRQLGYADTQAPRPEHILDFSEDAAGVRPAYLARHALTAEAKADECARLAAALAAAPPPRRQVGA